MHSSASRRFSTLSMPAESTLPAPARVTDATNGSEHAAVALAGVTKRFGRITALDAISLFVRHGELMTLLGPSGCGKTTLLHLVAGFLIPESGEIAIDGQRITDVPANLRASMQVELKEIQRKLGVTTIFVTHDQSEALSLSDRIAVIADGRIRQLDTPHEVYRHPSDRFVASFIGDANVLRARLERIEGAVASVALGAARVTVPMRTLEGSAIGSAVDLFVRPEDLRVAETH